MQKEIKEIVEDLVKFDQDNILLKINKLLSKYKFEEIPFFIYKIQLDIFLNKGEYIKILNTIGFLKEDLDIFNIDKNYDIENNINRYLIYSTYIKTLFILTNDDEIKKEEKDYNNFLEHLLKLGIFGFSQKSDQMIKAHMDYNEFIFYGLKLKDGLINDKDNTFKISYIDSFFKNTPLIFYTLHPILYNSLMLFIYMDILEENKELFIQKYDEYFSENKFNLETMYNYKDFNVLHNFILKLKK